ncbi:hypothetical protein [Teichococcus vastitatis]|uniref:Uncharacterized protein n=1 Tax=Teichococcus vastitatis TaxID=2307076 RepID=A0ABS9WC61_9PROT|nr:hypothetical protein [Pseudoroseomonas vastitatis]MCI0756882.1 hypothetical protein [Pseudoroseomonas vastitatis]
MDTLRALADHSIRRVLGAIALGITLVMAGLAARPLLALQSGALMTAALWLGLWGAALRAPYQDPRRSLVWRRLQAMAGQGARKLRSLEGRRQLASILAERLMWHADRTALVAAGLGLITLVGFALQLLAG